MDNRVDNLVSGFAALCFGAFVSALAGQTDSPLMGAASLGLTLVGCWYFWQFFKELDKDET